MWGRKSSLHNASRYVSEPFQCYVKTQHVPTQSTIAANQRFPFCFIHCPPVLKSFYRLSRPCDTAVLVWIPFSAPYSHSIHLVSILRSSLLPPPRFSVALGKFSSHALPDYRQYIIFAIDNVVESTLLPLLRSSHNVLIILQHRWCLKIDRLFWHRSRHCHWSLWYTGQCTVLQL